MDKKLSTTIIQANKHWSKFKVKKWPHYLRFIAAINCSPYLIHLTYFHNNLSGMWGLTFKAALNHRWEFGPVISTAYRVFQFKNTILVQDCNRYYTSALIMFNTNLSALFTQNIQNLTFAWQHTIFPQQHIKQSRAWTPALELRISKWSCTILLTF